MPCKRTEGVAVFAVRLSGPGDAGRLRLLGSGARTVDRPAMPAAFSDQSSPHESAIHV
jgi:hypothetical protein